MAKLPKNSYMGHGKGEIEATVFLKKYILKL